MLATRTQGRNQTSTTRGIDMGIISNTRTLTRGGCGGTALGEVCAQVSKFTIDTDGAIPLMGRKDKAGVEKLSRMLSS